MGEPEMPSAQTVELWVAPLDVDDSVLASLAAPLSPAERARTARYRYERHARQFAAGRGWLRHVLGEELGMPPGDVAITDGPGKPRLAGGTGPCFNLSRAGELALIGVAPREVGVDVERISGNGREVDAAGLACSPREQAVLRRLPPAARADAFLCWWTAKEAYLKATGLGLSFPPDRVEVGGKQTGDAVAVRAEGGPSGWWARQVRPAPGYVGAVVAEGRGWDIRLRPVTPPASVSHRGGRVTAW